MTETDSARPNEDELKAALREASDDTPSEPVRSHALTDRQANEMAAAHRPTVVVLAGTVASGKTTLITSLYERFSRGPIGPVKFAGSLTLPGFEARARGLRPQIGAKPPMPHTHRNAVPWLHLRVLRSGESSLELLFGDFDGEVFDRVVEGKDPPDSVPALRRADHLSIVLDGKALVTPAERPLARQRAIDMVDVLASPDVNASSNTLSLVLTKLDELNAAQVDQREAAREAIEHVRARLARRLDDAIPTVVETAAISESADLPIGHGVDELLDLWNRFPLVPARGEQVPDVPALDHQWFGRFGS